MFFRRKKKPKVEPSAETIEPTQDVPVHNESSHDASPASHVNSQNTTDTATPVVASTPEAPVVAHPTRNESAVVDSQDKPKEKPKKSIFARIKQGLSRTSAQFSSGLANLLLGKKAIDDELLEEIETLLLMADVGMDATTDIIDELTEKVARKQLNDSGALYEALQASLTKMLERVEQPFELEGDAHNMKKPYVILVVGVNGVGKTTTIGKLAKRYQNQGKKVMLAAGDTFRAAAVEQLQVWGDRNNVPVVAQHTGADSASVVYDAVQAAKSRNIDVLIADTAGRLHNKSHLMDELSKVKRVMAKVDGSAPHEVLLVLDAGTGQNAVSQADHFKKTAGVTGIALTKLDGTAKGGIIFALSKKHEIPIRYIGVGETIDDLQPFSAKGFIDALFDTSK